MTGTPDDRPNTPDDDRRRERLEALRRDEPRFDVTARVRARIEAQGRPSRRHGFPRPTLVAVALIALIALLGTAVVAPGALRAAGGWFKALVVHEGPQPGQPGGQPVVVPTLAQGGGPFRTVTLAAAQGAVMFPVHLPRSVPAGYQPTTVQLFQPDPAIPPQQVIVTYTRAGGRRCPPRPLLPGPRDVHARGGPPLVITYDAPGPHPAFGAAPGTSRPLTVGGDPAVHIDDAPSGVTRPDGSSVTTGRLVVERPDVVLLLGGDRAAGRQGASRSDTGRRTATRHH